MVVVVVLSDGGDASDGGFWDDGDGNGLDGGGRNSSNSSISK